MDMIRKKIDNYMDKSRAQIKSDAGWLYIRMGLEALTEAKTNLTKDEAITRAFNQNKEMIKRSSFNASDIEFVIDTIYDERDDRDLEAREEYARTRGV